MIEQELRELDKWIAERVMGWRNGIDADAKAVWYGQARQITDCSDWSPTTSPADALAVLEKCAEKCDKDGKVISLRPTAEGWCVYCRDRYEREYAEAETLPLAICLFAKKLYE